MTLSDLEWLFHDKMRLQPALLESERLNININNNTPLRFCVVLCIEPPSVIISRLASLYAQLSELTRCFSAVAELHVKTLLAESLSTACTQPPCTFSMLLQHLSVVGSSCPHNLCLSSFQRRCPLSLELTAFRHLHLFLITLHSVVFLKRAVSGFNQAFSSSSPSGSYK